jgi:hypothetical protein
MNIVLPPNILDFKQVWSFVSSHVRLAPLQVVQRGIHYAESSPPKSQNSLNNSFSIKSPVKSDNEFEKVDQTRRDP